VILYRPWSTFTKRNSPRSLVVVLREPAAPASVTVAPGMGAPDSSVTVP
jgi:hypothetical protein